MIDTALLDMYDAACLTGGPERAVDAAVVSLVERCQVRVQRNGQMTVVDPTPRHDVEAAVLDAIGRHGGRTITTVRIRADQDRRLSRITDRLVRERLLAPSLAWRMARKGHQFTPTSAGRRTLAQWQTDPPAWARPPATSAGRVALAGAEEMADQQLRRAIFGASAPTEKPRRSRGHWFGAGMAGGWGGGHSCGAGGSCGGGGCGGGGCGGGS